jgi:ribosomal protein S14
MIDENDYIQKPRKTPGHFSKKYKATCDSCGENRGYIDKEDASKLCRTCARVQVHSLWSQEKKKEVGLKSTRHFVGGQPWNKGQIGVYDEEVKRQWREKHSEINANPEYRKRMSCSKRNLPIEKFKDFSTTENQRERVRIRNSGLIKKRFKLDNFTCDLCTLRGTELHAHHMYSFDQYPTLRNNIYNLVTLCASCHDAFHKANGKGNNTKEQYLEFKANFKRKTVYILTGAPASGKSWVLSNSINLNLTKLDSDHIPKKQLVEKIQAAVNPIVAITVGASTFIKRNPQLDCQLIVIQEDEQTIKDRMTARGGAVTNTISKRIGRMRKLAEQAIFTGTSSEVLDFVNKL